MEWVALALFVAVVLVLLAGFPVAFSLAGTALVFAFAGVIGGGFEAAFLSGLPSRILMERYPASTLRKPARGR